MRYAWPWWAFSRRGSAGVSRKGVRTFSGRAWLSPSSIQTWVIAGCPPVLLALIVTSRPFWASWTMRVPCRVTAADAGRDARKTASAKAPVDARGFICHLSMEGMTSGDASHPGAAQR
ncbi:hypothetical protein D3C75_1005710 [compost metagenome]